MNYKRQVAPPCIFSNHTNPSGIRCFSINQIEELRYIDALYRPFGHPGAIEVEEDQDAKTKSFCGQYTT